MENMMGHNRQTASLESLTTEDRKTLRQAVLELSDSMTRVAAERDLQKEIVTEAFEKINVDKRMIRRIARTYFKSNFNEEVDENSSFEDFYTSIMKEGNS